MIIVQAKQSWLYKIGMKLIQASSHSQNVKQYSVYNPEDYPRLVHPDWSTPGASGIG
jgi:hypothetical protein